MFASETLQWDKIKKGDWQDALYLGHYEALHTQDAVKTSSVIIRGNGEQM